MLVDKRRNVLRLQWNRLLIICVLLRFVFSANAAVPDNRISNRVQRQELSLEIQLEAEQLLSSLGYWIGPVDGEFDADSRHALIAFQKVEGRPRTGRLTNDEVLAMRVATRPLPQRTGSAHVEIDLDRQVLFIVDASGSITHILPVCTGSEKTYMDHGQLHRAHTPRGKFKILRKVNGWRRSTLGLLYYPNYIHEGIAIHGSHVMAVNPASHGCIRIPMFAAKELSKMTAIGTEVIVYEDEAATL